MACQLNVFQVHLSWNRESNETSQKWCQKFIWKVRSEGVRSNWLCRANMGRTREEKKKSKNKSHLALGDRLGYGEDSGQWFLRDVLSLLCRLDFIGIFKKFYHRFLRGGDPGIHCASLCWPAWAMPISYLTIFKRRAALAGVWPALAGALILDSHLSEFREIKFCL